MLDKVALGQVFSEYFGFPANLHSTSCPKVSFIYHPGLVQWASSGASTKWTQPHLTLNNEEYYTALTSSPNDK
jgi:hypothetical protein